MKNEKNLTELNSQYNELTVEELMGVSGGTDEEAAVDWLSVGKELADRRDELWQEGIAPDLIAVLIGCSGHNDAWGIQCWCYDHRDSLLVQQVIAKHTT